MRQIDLKFILITAVCVITSSVAADSMSSKDISTIFTENEVVPDVIDVAPKEWAKISYVSGKTVDGGNELTPTQVKDLPKVEWNADPNAFYTLMMVDPDAPKRAEPKLREIGHWLVGNIPGDKVEEGETLYGFVGSGPPSGSGLHRYVFLIYKQNGKIDYSNAPKVSNRSRNHRISFSNKKFAVDYKLGELVAGNFYQAQYDDYVPTLHAQLASGTE